MVRRLAVTPAVAGTLAAIVLGLPSPARASGFDVPTVGNSQSGPVTADASAVYWNPGQLAFMDRGRLELGGQLLVGRVSYRRERRGVYQDPDGLELREPISPSLIDPGKTGFAETVRDTPIAGAGSIFAAGPVWRDRLWLGGGIYAPYAALLEFPADGPQRFAHTGVTLISAQAELALAARLHERVALGAGVSYVSTVLEFSRVQDFAALGSFGDALASPPLDQPNDLGPEAPTTVRELDTLGRPIWIQRGLGHGVTFNAGLAIKATDRLDLGLNYQHSTRVVARGNFTLDMNDPFFTEDLESQGLDFDPTVRGDATVRLTLPKRLSLGVGGRVGDRWWLHGSATWAMWRDFDGLDITLDSPQLAQPGLGLGPRQFTRVPRNFRDAIDLRANAQVRLGQRLALSGGVGYASPAAPDETIDAVTPDGHHLTWSTGLGVDLRPGLSLLVDLQGNHIVPRRVTASDFDLANGEYRLFIGAFGLHLRMNLGRAPETAQARSSAPAPAPAELPQTSAETAPPVESGSSSAPPAPEGPVPHDGDARGSGPPPPPPAIAGSKGSEQRLGSAPLPARSSLLAWARS